jgi:glycosyltransferase involved in cell wall biosynthesis
MRLVVVAPTYNNGQTVVDVVGRIAALHLPTILVNDGCTDDTTCRLEEHFAGKSESIEVLVHASNRGKAAALRTGFDRAIARGFTHAITIDTDGQHDPEDIPRLIEASRSDPDALVLGVRAEEIVGYPRRSLVGRRFSNLGIRLASGQHVHDSQSGFRIYPLGLIKAVPCTAGRFGFETEIITRAAWAGSPIRQVPITSRYLPPEQRVSHYRPWRDSLRCGWVQVKLMSRTLVPWPQRVRWPKREVHGSEDGRSRWRRFWAWMNPLRGWRELRNDPAAASTTAAGLALGAFIANLPIYGLQTFLSLYVARRLNVHPLAVVLGSHLSTPPVGPALVFAAVGVGHLFMHGAWPRWADFNPAEMDTWTLLGRVMLEWIVGSLVVGTACMAGVFFFALGLLRLVPCTESVHIERNPRAVSGVTSNVQRTVSMENIAT